MPLTALVARKLWETLARPRFQLSRKELERSGSHVLDTQPLPMTLVNQGTVLFFR